MRAVLGLLLLAAQATTTTFDVVSIKPGSSPDTNPIRGTRQQNNRWTGTRITLRELIQEAYETAGFDMPDRVIGGPAWLGEDQFDVVATSAAVPNRPELEAMVRAMLVDRFHLVSHLEKRTLSAFELTIARRDGRPGPKLRSTTEDCKPRCGVTVMFGPPNRMTSSGAEMARFAFVLSSIVLHQPVIDRTGLTGQFELALEFAPGTELAGPVASDAPSIFTAVEEQLGLKLKSVKAPLEVLVVDSADKPAFD